MDWVHAHAPALAALALRSAWESTLLALCTLGLFRVLPGLSSRAKAAIAGLAFAFAIALPLLPSAALLRVNAAPTGARELPALALPAETAVIVCWTWLALSVAQLGRLALGTASLLLLLRTAQPAFPELLARYRSFTHGRARRARLLLSDRLSAPGACGLLRPAVLLPRDLVSSLGEQDLTAILHHEAAHLNAGDDWLAFAGRAVRAVMPFAFGAVLLERRIFAARETACDQAALTAGVPRKSYAACLARLAESAIRHHALAPGLGGKPSELATRVEQILSTAPAIRKPGRLRLAAAGLTGAALCLGLVSAPSFVSFTPSPRVVSTAETASTALPTEAVTTHLRPASFQLPTSVAPAVARKPRTARHTHKLAARQPAVLQQVFWAAPPQPRVILLVPVVQAVLAPAWTRFVFLTL